MCIGVRFNRNGIQCVSYFRQYDAVLPVLLRSGHCGTVPWGRRTPEPGGLPTGGLADLGSIKQGQWDQYFPRSVQLLVSAFVAIDAKGRACWYPLAIGYVQGLVAREGEEERAYVVTIAPTIPEQAALYDCWPRIMFPE